MRLPNWKTRVEFANRTPKKKRNYPEDALQMQCVRWFRLQYPKRIIFSIPNGSNKSRAQAGVFKATGLTSGVPDLFVPEPHTVSREAGLFIEMKIKPNKPSDEQDRMITILRDRGYQVEVCYTFEEFQRVVRNYFGG